LERSDRIAGKVKTINSNGVLHEMGACWLSTNYENVRELMHDVAYPGREKPAGKSGSRDVVSCSHRAPFI
jgi:hypothetical protein